MKLKLLQKVFADRYESNPDADVDAERCQESAYFHKSYRVIVDQMRFADAW